MSVAIITRTYLNTNMEIISTVKFQGILFNLMVLTAS